MTAVEARVGQIAPAQIGSAQVGFVEANACQVGSAEVSPDHLGTSKTRALYVRPSGPRPGEVRPRQIRPPQIQVAHRRPNIEVGLAWVLFRPDPTRADKVRAFKVGANEDCSAQLQSRQIRATEIGVRELYTPVSRIAKGLAQIRAGKFGLHIRFGLACEVPNVDAFFEHFQVTWSRTQFARACRLPGCGRDGHPLSLIHISEP